MGSSVVDLQVMAYRALDELCSSLTDEEWALQTECPGWSVQDNLSHLAGTESTLLGRPAPDHDPGDKPWIRNPIGAGNEVQVDYRRPWPPQKVLEEFREISAERTKALRAMSDEELGGESWTPIGQGTVADLLAIRVMDFWVHEQDIRRAVGRPGGLEGPIARHAFGRHTTALPFVVGKKADAPEGTTVVYEITGPAGGTVAVGREGKRAALLEQVPDAPNVKLTMDLETFNLLCTGRGDPDVVAKNIKIEGDEALGRKVLGQSNFMV
ncbi:MAG: maleylpyruvate isomerase family mycothiol-dependent enzyme [Actinomycetota bacterium]